LHRGEDTETKQMEMHVTLELKGQWSQKWTEQVFKLLLCSNSLGATRNRKGMTISCSHNSQKY